MQKHHKVLAIMIKVVHYKTIKCNLMIKIITIKNSQALLKNVNNIILQTTIIRTIIIITKINTNNSKKILTIIKLKKTIKIIKITTTMITIKKI